jgi:hypothetical protein
MVHISDLVRGKTDPPGGSGGLHALRLKNVEGMDHFKEPPKKGDGESNHRETPVELAKQAAVQIPPA